MDPNGKDVVRRQPKRQQRRQPPPSRITNERGVAGNATAAESDHANLVEISRRRRIRRTMRGSRKGTNAGKPKKKSKSSSKRKTQTRRRRSKKNLAQPEEERNAVENRSRRRRRKSRKPPVAGSKGTKRRSFKRR